MSIANYSTLSSRIGEILKAADLETFTFRDLCTTLEKEMDCSLDDKRDFIRATMDSELLRFQASLPSAINTNADYKLALKLQAEEDEAIRKRPKRTTAARLRAHKKKKRSSATTVIRGSRQGRGFNRPHELSEQLADLLEVPGPLSRSEVVKLIWAHIKEHNLQDPTDRRFILCDQKLKKLFDRDRVGAFGMNKLLSKHLKLTRDITQPIERPVSDTKDQNNDKNNSNYMAEASEPSEQSSQDGLDSGDYEPRMGLPSSLLNIPGMKQNMRVSDALKAMKEYIDREKLCDPHEQDMIICDKVLAVLLEEDKTRVSFGYLAKRLACLITSLPENLNKISH